MFYSYCPGTFHTNPELKKMIEMHQENTVIWQSEVLNALLEIKQKDSFSVGPKKTKKQRQKESKKTNNSQSMIDCFVTHYSDEIVLSTAKRLGVKTHLNCLVAIEEVICSVQQQTTKPSIGQCLQMLNEAVKKHPAPIPDPSVTASVTDSVNSCFEHYQEDCIDRCSQGRGPANKWAAREQRRLLKTKK